MDHRCALDIEVLKTPMAAQHQGLWGSLESCLQPRSSLMHLHQHATQTPYSRKFYILAIIRSSMVLCFRSLCHQDNSNFKVLTTVRCIPTSEILQCQILKSAFGDGKKKIHYHSVPSGQDAETRWKFYSWVCCNDKHKQTWALCISLNSSIHLQPIKRCCASYNERKFNPV